MSNPRVYEIAKELGVPNKDLLSKLSSMGVEVKSHSSTVTPDVAEKLRSSIKGGGRQSRPAQAREGQAAAPARGAAASGRGAQPAQGRAACLPWSIV